MNTQLLIDRVVQQTMVFIAQLATRGGLRAPLAQVADRVFVDLTTELHNQGVTKKIIADMFGMALRTYHRKSSELARSRTESGKTLWEVVLGFLRDRGPIAAAEVQRRFHHDDPEMLTGVLSDLVSSGLVYRSGRGDDALFRVLDDADLALLGGAGQKEASQYLVWLSVYRNGPASLARISQLTRLGEDTCQAALDALLTDGRARKLERGASIEYASDKFDVPLGASHGWEAAVLDHFQAMIAAVTTKLALSSSRARSEDVVGGSTWTLDVWEGHPLEREALGTLSRVRAAIEDLRQRIDAHNAKSTRDGGEKKIVFYMGQYVREESEDETHRS